MRTTLIGLVLGLAAAAGPALADAGGGATVTLTDGNDHYTTTSNDSLVLAKGGNDVITVQAAYYDRENEIVQIAVYGGPGDDKIIGKEGIDRQTFYGGRATTMSRCGAAPPTPAARRARAAATRSSARAATRAAA